MNIQLLEQVEQRLRERPETYRQGDFFWMPGDSDAYMSARAADEVEKVEQRGWTCGAVACVAGHALALSGRIKEFVTDEEWGLTIDWMAGGAAVLDIHPDLADWLFDGSRYERTMPDVLAAIRRGASFEELEDIEAREDDK